MKYRAYPWGFMLSPLFLIFLSLSLSAQVRYVTPQGAGSRDGSSWSNAYGNGQLVVALGAAPKGTSFWLAAGEYQPGRDLQYAVPTDSRKASFRLRDSISLYGGFAGTETDVSQRKPQQYLTVLNGEIGSPATNTDNCFQVVTLINAPHALLDGVTVWNGYGDNANTDPVDTLNVPHDTGGGIFAWGGGTVANCTVQYCFATNGGGITVSGGGEVRDCSVSFNTALGTFGAGVNASMDAVVNNCVISNNNGSTWGGGLYLNNAFANGCTIRGNMSKFMGGGIAAFGSARATNCLVTGNIAQSGGGIYASAYGHFVNCTITGNSGTQWGGGVYMIRGGSMTNCIIWDNWIGNQKSDALFSDAQPVLKRNLIGSSPVAQDGDAVVSTSDPLFVNSAGGDYHLQPGSPAINAGDSTFIGAQPFDLEGESRVVDSNVDLGVYERQLPLGANLSRLYVKAGGAGSRSGSSWNDALPKLSTALRYAQFEPQIKEIWVGEGVYKPALNALFSSRFSNPKEATFRIPNSLQLYGGFAGTETDTAQRRPQLHPTILSGDIGVVNDTTDNAYHVVTMINDTAARVNGFVIERGMATGDDWTRVDGYLLLQRSGGGVYMHKAGVLENCVVRNNASEYAGGGVYIKDTGVVRRSLVHHNTTHWYGGGVYVENRSGVQDCMIGENTSANNGGGIYAMDADTVRNCVVYKNEGGGIYAYNKGVFINCTVTSNRSNWIAGFYGAGTGHQLINSIVWNNYSPNQSRNYDSTAQSGKTVFNTLVNNLIDYVSLDGTKVILSEEPFFVDTLVHDYRLSKCSPALNRGNNTYVAGLSTDLLGNPRVYQSTVDLGAIELQQAPGVMPAAPVITALTATTVCGTGTAQLSSSATTGNQWFLYDHSIPGASGQVLTVSAGGPYTVRAKSGECYSAPSPITTVTVGAVPPKPVITVNDRVLTTQRSNPYELLQWYMDDVAVAGATSATFYMNKPGVYKVQVRNTSCVNWSDPYNFTTTGLAGPDAWKGEVIVYPNPVGNQLYITNAAGRPLYVEVVDITGRVVRTHTFSGTTAVLPMQGAAPGVYSVIISDRKKGEKVMKMVQKQ